jgi:hypothetical protein
VGAVSAKPTAKIRVRTVATDIDRQRVRMHYSKITDIENNSFIPWIVNSSSVCHD